MKYLLCFAIIAVTSANSGAQNPCPATLDYFLKYLETVDPRATEGLSFKKCQGFDFENFRAVNVSSDSLDYYEIGIDKTGSIKEIIRHNKFPGLRYKFLVYESAQFRILFYQRLQNDKYWFSSLVFFMSKGKNSGENYMIDVADRYGEGYKSLALSYESFPTATLESISVIAKLNDSLYPERELKISKGQVVILSSYGYEANRPTFIKSETLYFFLTPSNYKNLELERGACIKNFMDEVEIGEYILSIRPDMREIDGEPLWILEGRHSYIK